MNTITALTFEANEHLIGLMSRDRRRETIDLVNVDEDEVLADVTL